MKITEKQMLADLLTKHTNCSCIARHMYSDEYYEWYLVLEYDRPAYVIKFHKEAQYFCDIIPLAFSGVSPIFANDVAEASLEWDDIQDENQSNTI